MVEKLKGYALLAVIIGIGVLTYVLTKGKRPIPNAGKEMEIIAAKAEIQKLQAEKGLEAAVAALEAKHASRIAEMDEASREQAKALRSDPKALTEFLLR